MSALLLGLLNNVLPGVINRVLPPEKMSEAEAAQLQQELTKELLAQDWAQIEAEYKDRDSARTLAAAEIAKGNAFTGALAAMVRPAWGFAALGLVAWNVLGGHPIEPGFREIVDTVLMFYFGGRVIEKVTPHVAVALQK